MGAEGLPGDSSFVHSFLDGNRLVTIPYTTFWPLRHLKRLWVATAFRNKLITSIFSPTRLLYGNLLTNLPIGIFQSQHLLTQLWADHDTNQLSMYITCELLAARGLHDNRLNMLRTEIFDDLPLLQELWVRRVFLHVRDLVSIPTVGICTIIKSVICPMHRLDHFGSSTLCE